mmetsp:Transcript_15306/g.47581  ORF Transcript_15306/g.47581 Transcript_15306/m.47581 type:complete len:259 (+) Transcript_15306:1071-1847(+)
MSVSRPAHSSAARVSDRHPRQAPRSTQRQHGPRTRAGRPHCRTRWRSGRTRRPQSAPRRTGPSARRTGSLRASCRWQRSAQRSGSPFSTPFSTLHSPLLSSSLLFFSRPSNAPFRRRHPHPSRCTPRSGTALHPTRTRLWRPLGACVPRRLSRFRTPRIRHPLRGRRRNLPRRASGSGCCCDRRTRPGSRIAHTPAECTPHQLRARKSPLRTRGILRPSGRCSHEPRHARNTNHPASGRACPRNRPRTAPLNQFPRST